MDANTEQDMAFSRKNELISYMDALQNLFDKAKEIDTRLLQDSFDRFKGKKAETAKSVAEGELLIPVTGGFSAGKSTALNVFLGEKILPVDVTPTTALPAELCYGEDEHLVALGMDGEEARHPVSSLPELSREASRYRKVRLYLNRPVLKKIEPFILVDMPGFDAAVEQHNQAILPYLPQGAFYLYFSNCQDGTLRQADIGRLNDIIEMGRSFAVFLTKTNLLPDSQVKEVCAHVLSQVSEQFAPNDIPVYLLGNDDAGILSEKLRELDANALFNNLFIKQVRELFYDASGSINTAISTLKSDKEKAAGRIEELKRALVSLEEERSGKLQSLHAGTLEQMGDGIVRRVEQALRGACEQLTRQARAGSDMLNQVVTNMVRGILVGEFNKVPGQLTNIVMRDVSSVVNFSFKGDFNISEDWMSNLASVLQDEVMKALFGSTQKTANGGMGTGVGGIAGIAISMVAGVNPVLKVALAILPGIIGTLFDAFRKSREEELIAEAIQNQMIPSVVAQVRPIVSNALSDMTEKLREAVSAQFDMKIREQKEMLEKVQDDGEATDAEEKIAGLSSLLQQVNELTSSNRIV